MKRALDGSLSDGSLTRDSQVVQPTTQWSFTILGKPGKILGKPTHGVPWNPMHVLVPDFSLIFPRTCPGFVQTFSGSFLRVFPDLSGPFYEKQYDLLRIFYFWDAFIIVGRLFGEGKSMIPANWFEDPLESPLEEALKDPRRNKFQ